MAKEDFFNELYQGLGNAIADIREKVVEEPYFGRVVNERQPEAPQWPEANEQSLSETEGVEQKKEQTPELDR